MIRPAHRILILLAVAALASSCARDLPTNANRVSAPAASARRSSPYTESELVGGQVVVTLAPGVSPDDIADEFDADLVGWDEDEHIATLRPRDGDSPMEMAARMGSDPRIATSESNSLLQPAESRQRSFAFDDGLGSASACASQPAAQAIGLNVAHATSLGDGIRVAVLDTGIDALHPAFAGRIVAAYDFVEHHEGADDVAYSTDTNGDGTLDGAWGHGTHVAGIVALTAPHADLMIGRVLDSDGVGDVAAVAAGIRWAVANHAKVINLSLGSYSGSRAISSALEMAEEHGVLVVAAAGNDGTEYPQQFPARSDDAGAVAASDAYAVPAVWTSYGRFVELCAPGVAIRSAYPGGEYRVWSGTSMSTPFVAGAAALLYAVHPYWSRSQMMGRLEGSARALNDVPLAEVGKLGAGMLDVGAALAPDASPDDPIEVTFGGH